MGPSLPSKSKMFLRPRYLILVFFVVVSAHALFRFWNNEQQKEQIISALLEKLPFKNRNMSPHEHSTVHSILEELVEEVQERPITPPRVTSPAKVITPPRANATFVMLARNSELKYVIETLKGIEDRFNRQFHYSYVFLNEEPFTDHFKRWTQEIISGQAYYGLIPFEHWYQPDHIDEVRAADSRRILEAGDVIYGGSVPYRNMCRFNSGFFYRHPLLQQFKYYWRIEPGVTFFCDVNSDPFMFMQENNKTYGFTISLYEFERTIPSLWTVTKEFMKRHPEHLVEGNALRFLSDDDGASYNLCHFWSNFEIADMDLWRSKAYSDYFDFLDEQGGFYYERWGDAPVHSIGAALFSKKEQIHFFREIGYRHNPFQHCPQGSAHSSGKCWCEEGDNFDYDGYSCTYRYERLFL